MKAALDRWREVIGSANVVDGEAERIATATTSFATDASVLAILRPRDRAEVQACVRIAHEERIALHPVSRGRNWGYGSRAPSRDAVILDLARLDRILDFDERLAYVTLEPGVTFRQLSEFLRSTQARVFASVTGGPADGSVIANALERGDGSGPLGDRFSHVCGLEVVLPTGECVRTGFSRFPGATTEALATWGLGPSLDGLFSQSGFGVVTRMTVWLTPYPVHVMLAAVTVDDRQRLPPVVDALRTLRLTGVTPATTPLWNDLKALSVRSRYPWDEAGGVTPLPTRVRQAMVQRAGLGAWNGTITLYGASRAHTRALADVVASSLEGLANIRFREGPTDPLAVLPEECGPALGVPHDLNVASVYWRKRTPVGTDPDADGCGFLWLSHAAPFVGNHAQLCSELVETTVLEGGFEPSIALLGVTPRALSVIASIAYDRHVPGEDDRARACHDRLFAQLVERGYPPFRDGVQSRALAPAGDPSTAQFVETLRRAIDPHDVFTTGDARRR
ncbi:MAG: FAD-binding oxidoreductase [Kofleriaceae bacterium]|nr:FAD-binding oxidoreductase [Kofleriaceae bacterium]